MEYGGKKAEPPSREDPGPGLRRGNTPYTTRGAPTVLCARGLPARSRRGLPRYGYHLPSETPRANRPVDTTLCLASPCRALGYPPL